jgi:NADH:ubiquinone oxidoreductase subunit F (NADH-binding)/NADH:ubiquinone oxidoreductase subunit E
VSDNLVQLRKHKGDFRATDNALQRLKEVMHQNRLITDKDISRIAHAIGQPEAIVHGVATYYGDLGLVRRGRTRVKVCKGTACFASAGNASIGWFEQALGLKEGETSKDGAVSLETVYCLGYCNAAPTVEVEGRIYGELLPEKVRALANDLAAGGGLPEAHAHLTPRFGVFGCEPIVLERIVKTDIDATRLDVARAHHALEGFVKALKDKTPDQILNEVETSGLRGRGGAGFPTATKWRLTAANAKESDESFVVCNGDEGDPGSYIDKYLMEKDPFAVLEGIALAGYAIGATRGFIYIRSEYPRSRGIVQDAIDQLRNAGLLGKNILGTKFSFDIDAVEGAGSYVCGEETALLRSLEGLRGMVTARPPYPADKGLFGKPTVVNNVETLANIGWIVRRGGEAYAKYGIGKSRGTKAVSLNELFVRPGLYEVPLGTSLEKVLLEIGGGLKNGRPIKCVQVGGPLGGILRGDQLDVPLGFEEFDKVGALLGHGGIVAWDDRVDVRDIAIHLFEFCDAESCGKCFPCRIGGRRGLEIVRRLKEAGDPSEIPLLRELLETLKLGSLCAHGGAIPDPIRSLLTHFEKEMVGA